MKENALMFNGKPYVSSVRASLVTGYTTDYIGQLCRAGRADCKLVGRTWYVEQSSLCGRKVQKRISSSSTPQKIVPIQRKGVYTERQRKLVEELSRRSSYVAENEESIVFEYDDAPLYPVVSKEAHKQIDEIIPVQVSKVVDAPILSPLQRHSIRNKTSFSMQGILIPVSAIVLFALATFGLEATYSYSDKDGLTRGVQIVSASEISR